MSPTAGTFEHGSSVLQLPADPDDPVRFEACARDLLAAGLTRPQPGRDDKVVTAWNGLGITALGRGQRALDRPEFLSAAIQCARRSSICIWLMAGCDGPAWVAASATVRRSWRIMRRWPPGC